MLRVRSIIMAVYATVVLLSLSVALPSGAATLTAATADNGVVTLQGIGIENAAAMEIIVQYDVARLSSPRVTIGAFVAGTMSQVNTTVPGVVRIDLISITPVNGSGVIATMIFEQRGSGGGITGMSARLADLRGTPLAAVVQINSPPASQAASSSPDTTVPSKSVPAVLSSSGSLPILTGPGSMQLQASGLPETEKASHDQPGPALSDDVSTLLARRDPTPVTSQDTPATSYPSRSLYAPKGILDRFQEFTGKHTAENVLALFAEETMIGLRQDPPVALSDGRSTVRVTFLTPSGIYRASDIAVMGARLLSLERDPDNSNTWIAVLLPEKGAWRATLAVASDRLTIIYPLTVAPSVDIVSNRSGAVNGKDILSRLLRNLPDLNNDGKQDSIDEFILTANVLKLQGTPRADQRHRAVR
jgi:hypothetical protein